MPDATKFLAELISTVENLCCENEAAKIMLQEYWPPKEKLSWRVALSQNCTAMKDRFHEQISEKLPVPELVVPAQFYAILAALNTSNSSHARSVKSSD
jgi:hypothetical protein